METLKNSQNGKFDLARFVKTYIYEASDLARKNISLNDFDEKIKKRVSYSLGIEEKIVVGLHHPCHWALFCNNNGSYTTLIPPSNNGDGMKVGLKRDYNSEDIRNLSKKVLEENANYYQAKIESLGLKV